MTYRILKLNADTNEWNVQGAGNDYAQLNVMVHALEADGEVYAIQHTVTGAWV
jgi:DNA-directed RNA polymerase subunit L